MNLFSARSAWTDCELIIPAGQKCVSRFTSRRRNTDERPANADASAFSLGGYGWDGSLLYLDERSEVIHRCERDDAASLNSWPEFDAMLVQEYDCLAGMFDETGRRRDPERPTTPT